MTCIRLQLLSGNGPDQIQEKGMKIINWEIKKEEVHLDPEMDAPKGYGLGIASVKDAWGEVEIVPAWIKVVWADDAAHVILINKKGDYNGLYHIVPLPEEEAIESIPL